MAALSDYLESGLLHHVFRGSEFPKLNGIAIALCSGVPHDYDTGNNQYTGGTLQELPSGDGSVDTGYRRYNLDPPTTHGDDWWIFDDIGDENTGSGVIKNAKQIVFPNALTDWGIVSGIAIVDSGQAPDPTSDVPHIAHGGYGTGNLIMHAELEHPREIYTGDAVKFDAHTLKIRFK